MQLKYPVRIEPLSGPKGGYLVTVPDLPDCMADGETPEEALANIREAIASWIESAEAWGMPVPAPSITRVPEAV